MVTACLSQLHMLCPVYLVNDSQQTLLHVGYTAACFNTHMYVLSRKSRTPSDEQESEKDFIYFYTTCSLKADQIWSQPEHNFKNICSNPVWARECWRGTGPSTLSNWAQGTYVMQRLKSLMRNREFERGLSRLHPVFIWDRCIVRKE